MGRNYNKLCPPCVLLSVKTGLLFAQRQNKRGYQHLGQYFEEKNCGIVSPIGVMEAYIEFLSQP